VGCQQGTSIETQGNRWPEGQGGEDGG
jgi:hypothetical protein